jgi:hypothetical protein
MIPPLREIGRRMPYLAAASVLVGVLIGVLVDPIGDWFLEQYDHFSPIIETVAQVVPSQPDDVVIRVTGMKSRKCDFVPPLQVIARSEDGSAYEPSIQRLDKPEAGTTRPIGPFGPQLWRIWPKDGATSITVYATYLCAGRKVIEKFAELKLGDLR